MIAAASPLSGIRGIAGYWERRTLRSQQPSPDAAADRVILDVLGLGIEQALRHLMAYRPTFAEFEDWVLATAGPPDPERVARYNAWVDGAAMPDTTAARLAEIGAMASVLDADEIAHWERNGYVVLRAAISAEEAAAVAALLWRTLAASPDDPASWYGPRTNGIMIQHFQAPELETARRSPRIHKAFAQLLGTNDLWSSTDRMSFNPPEHAGYIFPGPELHWDTSLVPPISLETGGILYLTDTAADQGALRVVPGFHHEIAGWLDGLGDANPRNVDFSARGVGIAGAAGDLVIWRQELPHGASRNSTARPRMAQYVNFYSPAVCQNPAWR